MAGRKSLFGRMKSRGAKPKKIAKSMFGEGGPAKMGSPAGGKNGIAPAPGPTSPRAAVNRPNGGGGNFFGQRPGVTKPGY